ncbi:hypothetical protein N657DRAFT_649239, partial [Parathielavia appendiculata]
MAASSSDCIASRTFALGFGVRLGRFGEGGRSATSITASGCAAAAISRSLGRAAQLPKKPIFCWIEQTSNAF